MAIAPADGAVWCSTNERDGLGDNVPPDYITRVRDGAFYGWPWYYIGANEDPHHRGERPELKDKSYRSRRADRGPLGVARHDIL